MRGLRPGVWHWQSPHPAWSEEEAWLPSINAIATGDSLSDFGDGLDIQLGGRKHATRDHVVRRLRPLLDSPVDLVLPAHGEPGASSRARARAFLSGAGTTANYGDVAPPWASLLLLEALAFVRHGRRSAGRRSDVGRRRRSR